MLWTGELVFHFSNVIVLTAAIAAYVLWRYRAAVLGGMRVGSGLAVPLPPAVAAATVTPRAQPERPLAASAWERRAKRRIAAVYLLSVAVPAVVLAGVYLVQSDLPKTPTHLIGVAGATMPMAIPMIALSLATPFWRAVGWGVVLVLATAVAVVALSMLQRMVIGKAPSFDQLLNAVNLLQLTFVKLSPALLLCWAAGNRRLRGVAPITFAGLLIFGLAPMAGSLLLQGLSSTLAGSAVIGTATGALGAWAIVHGGFLLLALPTGWVAWLRLRALARAYEAKRFSDVELLASTFWLMFISVTALELINSRPRPWVTLVGCAVAYAIFPPLNRFLFARAGLERGRPPARTLLLLRVFGNTARTGRLFDRIAARWRSFGPVNVIAAPDVVARTLDPGDFLRFVTGHVADNFVRSEADLEDRLARLDSAPDPDGRYRVNDFCCRDNTWQATVVALMQQADAVIMDVRGLTAERRGCEFELKELAIRLPPQKVVLVVDATSDHDVIRQAMADAYYKVRAVSVERNTRSETDSLFATLMEAADLRG